MFKKFTRKFRPLEILSEEQVRAIHQGTLEVIETTGVRIEHDRALALFAEHGCKVDFEDKRVRIPGRLVEESLHKCPSHFPVRARDSESDLIIGGDTIYFGQEVGMRAVDLDTWEPRPATLQEHNDAVRVMDALDTVAGLQAYQFYIDMEGVSPSMAYLEGLASGIQNTTKAQCFNHMSNSEVFAIKMAKAIGMDLLGGMTLSPPLTLYKDCCEAGFRFAEAEFPIPIIGGAAMGGTAPATVAGATITNNVEQIAAVVLLQLFKPGTKVLPTEFVYPMNMRNGNLDFGAMSIALHTAIFNQIWRSYGIPRCIMCGGYSNSKKIDFQNAYEKSMMNLIAAISGTNIAFFQGSMYGELTYHPLQAVLDDDIAGWIGHFVEGVEVDDETMAIDLINQIGPIPGNYLHAAHTRKWWKEHFIPKVADRESYPEWLSKDKKDTLTLAKERLERILAGHEPKSLTSEQNKAINEILEEARNFYREKGIQ